MPPTVRWPPSTRLAPSASVSAWKSSRSCLVIVVNQPTRSLRTIDMSRDALRAASQRSITGRRHALRHDGPLRVLDTGGTRARPCPRRRRRPPRGGARRPRGAPPVAKSITTPVTATQPSSGWNRKTAPRKIGAQMKSRTATSELEWKKLRRPSSSFVPLAGAARRARAARAPPPLRARASPGVPGGARRTGQGCGGGSSRTGPSGPAASPPARTGRPATPASGSSAPDRRSAA